MEALLVDPAPIPDSAREPLDGKAVGNVLHTDALGRFHVMAVVVAVSSSLGVARGTNGAAPPEPTPWMRRRVSLPATRRTTRKARAPRPPPAPRRPRHTPRPEAGLAVSHR